MVDVVFGEQALDAHLLHQVYLNRKVAALAQLRRRCYKLDLVSGVFQHFLGLERGLDVGEEHQPIAFAGYFLIAFE
jgi:hypothetical protein